MQTGKRLDETEIQIAIATLQGRMDVVEQGVANFRAFQKDARDFFTRHDARELEKEKLDKRRARIHFALLAGLISLVTSCAIILFQMWAQGHHISSNAPTAVSQSSPEHAQIPHI